MEEAYILSLFDSIDIVRQKLFKILNQSVPTISNTLVGRNRLYLPSPSYLHLETIFRHKEATSWTLLSANLVIPCWWPMSTSWEGLAGWKPMCASWQLIHWWLGTTS